MTGEQEMFFHNESGNIPRKLVDDFEKVKLDHLGKAKDKVMLTDDLHDKWLFPRATHYLGTVLRSGEIRPLSPTLKIHSPESVFPGIAILCEGFDDMREWKNTIEFVGFFASMGNMFDSRHHWDMRTKFVEVRVRCMDKIIEDPCGVNRTSEGGFFLRIPLAVQQAMEEERRKTKLACDVEGKKYMTKEFSVIDGDIYIENQMCAKKKFRDDISKENSNINELNYFGKELGITVEEESNFEINNCAVDKKLEIITEDEKLKHESLQNGLSIVSRPEMSAETLCSLPGTECGRFPASKDIEMNSIQDLIVIGKSFQVQTTTELVNEKGEPSFKLSEDGNVATKNLGSGLISKSETWFRKDEEKLVLEDINDKDFVPGLILPSPCKLTGVETNAHVATSITSSRAKVSTNVVCEEMVHQHTAERPKQDHGTSRLRRRIASLFSCFGRNRVTPVDI